MTKAYDVPLTAAEFERLPVRAQDVVMADRALAEALAGPVVDLVALKRRRTHLAECRARAAKIWGMVGEADGPRVG